MACCHYLNQCWNIVNWTLKNKLQRNFDRNSNILIQENALANVVWGLASILFLPRCANSTMSGEYNISQELYKRFAIRCFSRLYPHVFISFGAKVTIDVAEVKILCQSVNVILLGPVLPGKPLLNVLNGWQQSNYTMKSHVGEIYKWEVAYSLSAVKLKFGEMIQQSACDLRPPNRDASVPRLMHKWTLYRWGNL